MPEDGGGIGGILNPPPDNILRRRYGSARSAAYRSRVGRPSGTPVVVQIPVFFRRRPASLTPQAFLSPVSRDRWGSGLVAPDQATASRSGGVKVRAGVTWLAWPKKRLT